MQLAGRRYFKSRSFQSLGLARSPVGVALETGEPLVRPPVATVVNSFQAGRVGGLGPARPSRCQGRARRGALRARRLYQNDLFLRAGAGTTYLYFARAQSGARLPATARLDLLRITINLNNNLNNK